MGVYIRQHLAKYGIEAAADLWDPAHTALSLSRQNSLLAVASGKADIGAIDCLTWHILQNLLPEQVAQTHIAGYSPQMPGPPLVTMLSDGCDRRAHLEAAIQAAFADTDISAQMKTLGITGYISGDCDRYNDFQACVI